MLISVTSPPSRNIETTPIRDDRASRRFQIKLMGSEMIATSKKIVGTDCVMNIVRSLMHFSGDSVQAAEIGEQRKIRVNSVPKIHIVMSMASA